jgi:hypothetical protein
MIDEKTLIELYPTTKNKELAKMFHVAECTVFRYANKIGLKKTKDFFKNLAKSESVKANQFKKGHVPFNKGVKGYTTTDERKMQNMKSTQFKKGTIPPNHRPVGSERFTKDGYIERKTAEPRKWELLHRVVWREHNGEIPHGYNVQFKDGNPHNCNIENLYLISRRDQMTTKNSIHAMPKEIAELYQLKGALKRKINRLTNLNK